MYPLNEFTSLQVYIILLELKKSGLKDKRLNSNLRFIKSFVYESDILGDFQFLEEWKKIQTKKEVMKINCLILIIQLIDCPKFTANTQVS